MRNRILLLALASSCLFVSRATSAAPVVWAIDDGEKIKRDVTSLPFKDGTDNPVWKPGAPISVFALRNETIAMQIVVQADATPLTGVTVDLDALVGPGGAKIQNAAGATDPTSYVGRPIERFLEEYFDVKRVSSSNGTAGSLGWADGSGPPPTAWIGWMPDALIPIEVAPAWAPYPMSVSANSNRVIWIDVTTTKDQPAGRYTGNVVVKAGATSLATIPVQLDVLGATLPDRPIKTMLFYDPGDLNRVGSVTETEKQLWRLYHRHRLSPMHSAYGTGDVASRLSVLDGSFYTATNGYDGPGVGLGDGILSLGTYGSFGAPSSSTLKTVESIADALAAAKLFSTTDVFVYAIDETCSSSYGSEWKTLIAGSSNANVKNVKVGWTCSTDPSAQPVDVPIVWGGEYNLTTANAARAKGKDVWIYNGARPGTGSFFTDAPAIELRANGWISGVYDTGRWFYWETAFWYDGNKGGLGPYDPFVTSETFHNSYGDECQGDGVLVYPGKQVDYFTSHSVGMNGVLASIRLKNFRRGVEDAGYYQLARAADATKADAIAKPLLGKVLADAKQGAPVNYPEKGKPYFDARKALADLIPKDALPGDSGPLPDGAPDGGTSDSGGPLPDGGTSSDARTNGDTGGGSSSGCGCRTTPATTHGDDERGWIFTALGALAIFATRRGRSVRRPSS